MIQFTNYFTTPTGRKCSLREIKNNEYFILLKFIQAKDYKGFYNALDSIIIETIPDFATYDILEKATVYLATCFYSVHNVIVTGGTDFINRIEISVAHIINLIEDVYKNLPQTFTYNIDTIIFTIGLPKFLDIEYENIAINYISGIQKINNTLLNSKEDTTKVTSLLPPKELIKIEKLIKKYYFAKCTLFENTSINIINGELFYLIFQVFAEPLGDYYQLLYYHFEYLKWDFNTFSQFTPLETRIIFNLFKEDKEKQAEEQQRRISK